MAFTSIHFLIFFPITVILFFLIPQRFRYIWLLLCSYFFYLTQSGAFVSSLIASTLITWVCGNIAYKAPYRWQKRLTLVIGLILNIGLLAVFKYTNFALSLVGSDTRVNLILPVGISFYTFQSLTYLIDCYKEKQEPERNILKYALFVSFFPSILSGPIARSTNLIPQFSCSGKWDTNRFKTGMQLMLWGYFQKLVIVDRLSIVTNLVYENYESYSGAMILLAGFAYTLMIYCDFAGYSSIAIGCGRILGFDLGVNFKTPYLVTSIAQHWRQWHISLSTWFKDYVYIPLGGSRLGKWRQNLNILIVFAVSGIWHGANLTYIFWGLLHGLYQVIGKTLMPIRNKITAVTHLDKAPVLKKWLQIIGTFLLIDLSFIFFAAPSLSRAFTILKLIFTKFEAKTLIDGTISTIGLGYSNLLLVIFALFLLFLSDLWQDRMNCDITGLFAKMPTIMRWGAYYLILMLIIFSANLSGQEFIYAGF